MITDRNSRVEDTKNEILSLQTNNVGNCTRFYIFTQKTFEVITVGYRENKHMIV